MKQGLAKILFGNWSQNGSLVCDKESPKLGGDGILVEADEVAIGSRKYQKGKRQRIEGVQWVRHFLFRRFLF